MIYLIGMGPGKIEYVTDKAIQTIEKCSKVIAFGRIAKTAEKIKEPIISVTRVSEVQEHIDGKQDVAILASGDPCFYGILEFLKKNHVVIDEVIPGLSSFQYMMCKLQKSWQDAKMFSLHGRDAGLQQIKNNPLSIVLTDRTHTPNYISKELLKEDIKGTLYIGFNLSYEDEEIIKKNIGETIPDQGGLAVVVIEHEMD